MIESWRYSCYLQASGSDTRQSLQGQRLPGPQWEKTKRKHLEQPPLTLARWLGTKAWTGMGSVVTRRSLTQLVWDDSRFLLVACICNIFKVVSCQAEIALQHFLVYYIQSCLTGENQCNRNAPCNVGEKRSKSSSEKESLANQAYRPWSPAESRHVSLLPYIQTDPRSFISICNPKVCANARGVWKSPAPE